MADNWGTDFWGAFSEVSKAREMQKLFANQQAGQKAFGQAMTDPGIFMPGAPQGGQPQQPQSQGGGAPPPQPNTLGMPSGGMPQPPQAQTQQAAPANWPAIRGGIFKGESGGDPNTLYGHVEKNGPFAGTKLTNMTVDQALAFAGPNGPYGKWAASKGIKAAPLGEYQIIHSTLADAKRQLGLSGNELMTPQLQEALGQHIYKQQGTGAWSGYKGPQSGGGGQAPQDGGQPPQGGQPPPQLSWQHIVQAIQQKNPDISPNALAEAVTLFQPMMTQQSQQEWREMSLQLREQSLQQQEQFKELAATQQQANEQGRNDRANNKDAAVQKRFDVNQDRLTKGFNERVNEFKEKAATATTKANKDYAIKQSKYFNDKLHQRVVEMAATGNSTMPADQKQKILDDEMARYNAEKEELDAASQPVGPPATAAPPVQAQAGQPPAQGGATPPQAPAGDSSVPVLGAMDKWATEHLPGWQGSSLLQGGKGGASTPAAAAPELKSADELKAAVAKGPLPKGTKYNGYTYNGGEVTDPKSWTKG